MRSFFITVFIFTAHQLFSQELYVFTEPASNMPSNSITLKISDHFISRNIIYGGSTHRIMPQVNFGFSKKFMLHASATISNMHTNNYKYESFNIYVKYRFLSLDEIHKHFRMAVYLDGSKTRAPFHFNEISLMGDKSGIGCGIIATQLKNKFAVTGTLGYTGVLDKSRNDHVIYVPARTYQSMDYSLSTGYLLLPRVYTSYKQVNLNLYLELLGQQSLDHSYHYTDLAPAFQLIFNSNAKLNIGYRTQLSANSPRMSKSSWLFSFERTFLGILRKK